MKINVLTILDNTGQPLLPPMDANDGYQLHYIGDDGQLHGGYSLLSQAPLDPNTLLVQVDASPEVIDLMIEDTDLDLQFWEYVQEQEVQP